MDYYALYICIFVIALLYSAVGQGGGSGYIAVMALFTIPSEEIKPIALVLNILVSGISAFKFYQSGAFSWKVFFPVTLLSLPFAFVGGLLTIPSVIYGVIAGIALIVSSYFLFRKPKARGTEVTPMPIGTSLAVGSTIGFVSGATGLGGGIFLSPLLLLKGWADSKHVPGISAGFIFVNSISALSGHYSSVSYLPEYVWILLAVALFGAIVGSKFGSQRAGNSSIIRLLACILFLAGVRLLIDQVF